ncbi:MAG: lipopolysaccharide heptosyltransferase II [Elusimicrobia bacterium RIFOXYB2_FULL_49_7]|nr:MAG: lipopolysaccharide heptosyltransferase II [Elusimicrobia bacterium RIFOXYB2_FULL_49_7]
MGNAILYSPVIKALAERYPNAVIDILVGNRAAEEAVRGLPGVREILLFRRDASLTQSLSLFHLLKKKKYDLYLTSFLDKSLKVALLGFLLRIPRRIGFACGWWKALYTDHALINEKQHEVEYNLDLLKLLSISSADDRTEVVISPEDTSFAIRFLAELGRDKNKPLISMHPGSGSDIGKGVKRWPAERFAQVADMLSAYCNAQILILGGKEEEGLARQVAAFMSEKPLIATGKTTVKQTAALLQQCRLFLSNDSGLMHLAAALNTPVVAIFGPTLHWKNYPWKVPYKLMRKDVGCNPCYSFKTIQCKEPKCLLAITVDEVSRAAEGLLNGR